MTTMYAFSRKLTASVDEEEEASAPPPAALSEDAMALQATLSSLLNTAFSLQFSSSLSVVEVR
jgi:hypothetical protein